MYTRYYPANEKGMSKHITLILLQKSKSFAHSFIDDIYIYSQYLKEEEPKRKIPKRKQKLNPRKCPHLPLDVVSLQGHRHGDGCHQGQTLPEWTKGQGHCHLQNQVNIRQCSVFMKNKNRGSNPLKELNYEKRLGIFGLSNVYVIKLPLLSPLSLFLSLLLHLSI